MFSVCWYRMFVSIWNVYVLMTNVCFFFNAHVLFSSFFFSFFFLFLSHTRPCIFMQMFTHAHVYTRTCLYHSSYRASHGLSDDEIRMSRSSFVRIWQPLKEERCSLRSWKCSFRSCGCEVRILISDFLILATACGLVWWLSRWARCGNVFYCW